MSDLDLALPGNRGDWTHADVRGWIDALSDEIGEYQGLPVPLGEDTPLVLHPKHPARAAYMHIRQSAELAEGEVEFNIIPDDRYEEHACTTEDVCEDEIVVNEWWSRRIQRRVIVFHRGGRAFVVTVPESPDRSMDRLTLWMTTLGASDAWDLDAEHKAREHLRAMLTERQWRHYDLTGSFFESSERSRLTYLFRRLRPTVALSPRDRHGGETHMRCVACLCLHPIGYYARSWGGCMVPTDDVIAHLTLMRADEAGFWGKAVQHAPSDPEAGL